MMPNCQCPICAGAEIPDAEIAEPPPLFAARADATIGRVVETYTERGTQYGDTWANCQFLCLAAVARHLKLTIPPHARRAVAAAVMVDMKHQRLEGGYKDDSIIDGIAYAAFLAAEMEQLKA